ncbi:MAG: LamG domain-containing protein [Planctomycetota bacterium]
MLAPHLDIPRTMAFQGRRLPTGQVDDGLGRPSYKRKGVSVLLVLAIISMTLALSYAMLRTQATVEQTERNTSHRATARQAALTGMSVALRTITEPTWGGVDAGLSGNLGDGSTFAVQFETGDASLLVGSPDYFEYPYRLTITSTGSVVDPANPQIQATHKVRNVVQFVRRKLVDAPGNWSAMQAYTVYQWGTGTGREVDAATPLHVEGPVFFQNQINYLTDYPGDGDDKAFDGLIDEVMILKSEVSAGTLQAIVAATLNLLGLGGLFGANPVAWWRFNEASGSLTAVDQLGHYNGRHEGSSAGASPATVNGGSRSADFDGYDDHVDLPPIDVSGSALTIMAWIKIDDFDHADARIISKANGTNDSDHYWSLETVDISGNKRLKFRLKTDVGGTDVLTASSGNLTTNTWTFVAAVYDGVTMKLYKDGQLVGWKIKHGSISTNSSVRVAIGNNPSGSPRARLLRDFEAMRAAGQGDFRPFSGPINAPLSLTSAHVRRLLEKDSNVALSNVAVGSGTPPVTHPGDIPSYRLYPGGKPVTDERFVAATP